MMSKLQDLIQELCPNGVEYKKIYDVAEVGTGSCNGNEAEEGGAYPFFVRSQSVKAKNDFQYDEEAIIIPGEGGIGDIFHYVNGKYALHQRVYRIHFIDETINVKFIYYYMKSNFKSFILKKAVSATVISIRKPMIEKFEIPMLPIEVQNEIVKILDRFADYAAELQAELQVRQEQYEYYRNKLLNFNDIIGKRCASVTWMKMSEICEIGTGSSNTQDELSVGLYPFFVRSQIVRRKDEYEFDETAIITSGDGVGVGKIFHYVEGRYALHQRAYRIHVLQEKLMPKFLFHYMRCNFYNYITKNAYISSVTSIRKPMLLNFPIPILSLEEQRWIVNILDKFEALTSDLSQGLPAEITAVQEQYEYYRNKLLSFPRNKISA